MAVSTPTRPGPPARDSATRRVVRFIGVVMLLAGLGFLGYVAWQYWGTNVVAKQKQAEVKELIADNWGAGKDGEAIGLLRISRFGADFEVPINNGGDFSGKESDDALAKGVAWYDKGAKPGEIGNFVIAGHRVTHGEPFRDFLKLKVGDEVVIETRRKVYTYVLRNDGDTITVDFSVGWPLWPIPNPDLQGYEPADRLLTMVTCSELFHTDNRNVVTGALVTTEDKATGTITEADEPITAAP